MLNTPLDAKILRSKDSYIAKLKAMGIFTVEDLLFYFPRAYRDEKDFISINEMKKDQVNVISAKIKFIRNTQTRSGKIMTRAIVADSSGEIPVLWFNQAHIKQMFFKGSEIILTGKIKESQGRLIMMSPKYEKPSKILLHTGRIVPIYPESEIITSKWLREKIHHLLSYTSYIKDYLPEWILEKESLMSLEDAVHHVHFAEDEDALKQARKRLAFDELFFIQLEALQSKAIWQKSYEDNPLKISGGVDEDFLSALPFELTTAQIRVIEEIHNDLNQNFPMRRLVQGDVGAGKTVVAAAAIHTVLKSGFQAALMAPTEILARQHYKSLMKLLHPFQYNIQWLVGSMSKTDKEKVLMQVSRGTCDLLIGTHALIQENVVFKNLGLAVVDEQHRFGVKQREMFNQKGRPHMLSLSATPIPRTMALTIYGDQDLSILDELPPGRQEIITRLVPEKKRSDAEFWVSDQIAKGRQVFVICPLIEDSEVIQVKSATDEYKRLCEEVFPEFKLALLHGRMKSHEKEYVLKAFACGDIDILVSTSVVEVGIDIPNASIMIIEGADRFGLAQLHQFRGRVGRGTHQSYCFLFTDSQSLDALQRLKLMAKYSSGFDLAEIDLKLRGPGEVYGLKQSGIPDLRMASFGDTELLKRVRNCAQTVIKEDIHLDKYPKLKKKLKQISS